MTVTPRLPISFAHLDEELRGDLTSAIQSVPRSREYRGAAADIEDATVVGDVARASAV